MKYLIGLMYFFIAYGSLYPFDFSLVEASYSANQFLNTQVPSLGDIVGNVLLFLPLGFLYSFQQQPQNSASINVSYLYLQVAAFALILQVLQVALPQRDQNIVDVAFNLLGFAIGLVGFKRGYFSNLHLTYQLRYLPYGIAALLVLAELSPFVPSIDFQGFKNSVKPLAEIPNIADLGSMIFEVVLWMLAIRLCFFNNPKFAFKYFIYAWVIVLIAKVVIHTNYLTPIKLVALPAAVLLTYLLNIKSQHYTQRLFYLGLAAFGLSSIASFDQLTLANQTFIPFHGYLDGSLFIGLQVLLTRLFFYSSIIWLAIELGKSAKQVAVWLAVYVGIVELLQLFMSSRVSDFGEVFVVASSYLLVRHLGDYLATSEEQQTPLTQEPRAHVNEETNGSASPAVQVSLMENPVIKRMLIWSGITIISAYFSFQFLLSLPNVPYNIVELFNNDGSIIDIAFILTAIFSFIIFSIKLGSQATHSIKHIVLLPLKSLVISAITFLLLWASVTNESLADIVGSSVFVYRVSELSALGDIGVALIAFFGADNVKVISDVIEPWVRFWALTAPIQFSLIVMAMFFHQRSNLLSQQPIIPQAKLMTLVYLLPWLHLCKIIAFDWSSTDNLNEIIARENNWGIGGGIYLYGLVMWMVAIGLSWGFSFQRKGIARKIGLFILTVLSLPLGWWLLNQGLVDAFTKYSQTYSGIDFLLGPDRATKLSESELMLRWCIVQIGFIGVMASGGFVYQKIASIFDARLNNPALYQRERYVLFAGAAILALVYAFNVSFKDVNKTTTTIFKNSEQQTYTKQPEVSIPKNVTPGRVLIDGKLAASLADAFKHAERGSTIRIQAGYYQGGAALNVDDVVIEGDPGAIIYGDLKQQKAALNIAGNNITVRDIECHSISNRRGIGACVAFSGNGLVLDNLYIHHSEAGLVTPNAQGQITILNSRFDFIGSTKSASAITVTKQAMLLIENSKILNTKEGRHAIKSFAASNRVVNTVIAGSEAIDSRLMDLPYGGRLTVVDSVLVEGRFSENHDLIGWGHHSLPYPDNQVEIRSSLIVSDKHNASLFAAKNQPEQATIEDNIVVGDIEGMPKRFNTFFESRDELSIPPPPFIPGM